MEFLFLILVLLFFYFLPSLFAWGRDHHNFASILILNIFLGWTFLGWIAALI